jgi:hypothetical protein
MSFPIIRQSLHLDGFDPDQLAEIVRGGRFEHYILARSKCSVRHQRWACGNFSVDVGYYSFPVRACGAFAADQVCVGYMRALTEPTWVNGFAFGLDAFSFIRRAAN